MYATNHTTYAHTKLIPLVPLPIFFFVKHHQIGPYENHNIKPLCLLIENKYTMLYITCLEKRLGVHNAHVVCDQEAQKRRILFNAHLLLENSFSLRKH